MHFYYVVFLFENFARQWWLMPLIPAVGRQRQVGYCEFEDSLVYKESSSVARAVRQPVWGQG